ncbi:hypothetical protein ACIGO8_18430 [Streptomyces sp. NPDC053493]|uniref:hypothetical protein n=1 Tax=Streptomyces sp. NPDC053493 TaxID=3365705 RepID=UPI0037CE690B
MSTIALKGPYWVTVRQHRWSLWATLVFAALASAALIASWYWAVRADDVLAAAGCPADSVAERCFQAARERADAQWQARHMVEFVALGMVVLPAVLAGYMAGPLIARELETGTYKLAWTQSVSPARWLAAKLAVPAAFTVVPVLLVTLVFQWSWSSGPADDFPTFWFDATMYAAQPGTVPVAAVLFGLATGALVGLLVRRTVPALAAATLLTGAVLAVLAQLRPRLWPVETLTGRHGLDVPARSWVVESGRLTRDGTRVSWQDCYEVVRDGQTNACMAARGAVTDYADVHPPAHFWPLQLVETGILTALAALALLAAFRVLRARHP